MKRSHVRLRKLTDYYELGQQIGKGQYGTVYKAHLLADKDADGKPRRGRRAFAVKMFESTDGHRHVTSNTTLREIKLLRELSHVNIVALRDTFLNMSNMSCALVFDYARTDLNRIIWESKRTKKPIADQTVRLFLYQMLLGVRYLHENWIIHRDIKPANILIAREGGKEVVKITDFGLARIFQAPVKALAEVDRVVVTLWYRAPELLLGSKHYTTAVDMWAIGCIMAEMLNWSPLFPGHGSDKAVFQEDQCKTIFKVLGVPTELTWPGISKLQHYNRIKPWTAGYPSESMLRSTVPSAGSERAYELLSKLLELDPAKRMTAEQALQHEYFRKVRDMVNTASKTSTGKYRYGYGSAASSASSSSRPGAVGAGGGSRRGLVPGRGSKRSHGEASSTGGGGAGGGAGAGAGAGAGRAVRRQRRESLDYS